MLARKNILQAQTLLFRELLEKVWKNSDFYRDYYGSHGIREQDLADVRVEDLPFISKRLLMENFDRAVTDPRLKIKELEKWLDGVRDPRQRFHQDFIVMHSSGSSGITGIFVYSWTDWQIMNSMMAGRLPQPENQRYGKTRVAFYRATHGHFAGVATAVHLPPAIYETLLVSLLEPLQSVIEQLHRFQPHRLTGYSSSIALLAEQAIEGKLQIQPQRIFVSGDLLTAEMAQKINDAWGTPISNLYGASESLFLAMKDSNDEQMTVMSDLNVLEILDEENRAVKAGEEGRVVITNLYNFTVPILRYELGDYVTRGTAPEFETIESIRPGKTNDALPIVLNNGKLDEVSPRAPTSFYACGIERAQFISQSRNRVRIDYIARNDVDDRVRSEFQRILDLKGASRTAFEVRRVPSIPADPKTGKVKLVVLPKEQTRRAPLNFVSEPLPQPTNPHSFGSNRSRLTFVKTEIEQSISNRFEHQVEKYSNRLAVSCAATSLTYNNLNRNANRIAHAILACRSEEQEPVAFLLGQGTPAIATILGILKAGKFYLPLDPSYPADWLVAILNDAHCSLIVTNNANLRSALTLDYEAECIINIDDLDPNLPDYNPGLLVSPDALAHLYYTSGSTGHPKGVVQNHRHALHQIMTYTNGLRLSADDRCTLLHSHGFSASRLDIFGPLLNGAAVLPFSLVTQGVLRLSPWLREEEVTIFHWVPSAFRHFLGNVSGSEQFSSIRWVILGSEPVTARDVELFKKHFSASCTLANRYGTTETGNICFYFIDKDTQLGGDVVPVGIALEDVEVLLLDETGHELGFGQVGEIAVKSPYFSGYWRQSDLTRASFAADPASSNKTIYRTGDIGYMLPGSCLVHLGRKDLQAKVRGHRVEVGQVERVLLEHPAVREAAVVARGDPSGETGLVAYIVGTEEATLTTSTLRSFLETRLPVYMVPGIFMQLNALPMTPAGKLDRRSLPEPIVGNLAIDSQYAEPRNAIEKKLAKIWSEVLQIPRVGIYDRFLDLGGHSLLVGNIISRISETCQFEISFRDFFEHPTVALLAELVSRNLPKNIGDEELASLLVEIESVSEEEALEAVKKHGE